MTLKKRFILQRLYLRVWLERTILGRLTQSKKILDLGPEYTHEMNISKALKLKPIFGRKTPRQKFIVFNKTTHLKIFKRFGSKRPLKVSYRLVYLTTQQVDKMFDSITIISY